jgi:coenzyme F420-reducing hydrogenase gamma subunit
MARPKLAVWKFASCDGCQLQLLDLEDAFLALAGRVEIAHFLEATSRVSPGPYDVSLVEGSISKPGDVERITRIREESRTLVAIGACAVAGGIQALRNTASAAGYAAAVYPDPAKVGTLETSTPVSAHVPVDLELRGCPVSKAQLLDALCALLAGRRPRLPRTPQCAECKAHGTVCVMVSEGTPCLGPVTQAGCGNLCPAVGRGCYGCFGPAEGANLPAMAAELARLGLDARQVRDAFRSFNAAAPAFAEAAEAAEGRAGDD